MQFRNIKRDLADTAGAGIIEVADEKTIEQASVNEINIVKEKEGERLIKNIKDDAYVICLAD